MTHGTRETTETLKIVIVVDTAHGLHQEMIVQAIITTAVRGKDPVQGTDTADLTGINEGRGHLAEKKKIATPTGLQQD